MTFQLYLSLITAAVLITACTTTTATDGTVTKAPDGTTVVTVGHLIETLATRPKSGAVVNDK